MSAQRIPFASAPSGASLPRWPLILVALLACAAIPLNPAAAADPIYSFHLASQYDYAGNRGFCLDLEGRRLAALGVALWVGDGVSWRALYTYPAFEFGPEYQLRAVITPTGAQVMLDGSPLIDSPGRWTPASTQLDLTQRPPWADQPDDWIAIVGDIRLALIRDGEEVERHEFTLSAAAQRMPLPLFEPGPPRQAAMQPRPGDTLVVDAVIRFGNSELDAWAPLIDSYGQCAYADFPEKVRTDADLVADLATEEAVFGEMPESADFDQYGGYLLAGWREQVTGFFRTVKRDGYWWLISPEGNPCFYIGMDNVRGPSTPVTGRESLFQWLPPRELPWEAAWLDDPWGVEPSVDSVAFSTANLIRKYGEDDWWIASGDVGRHRLRSWGFSGGGKWDSPYGVVLTPVLRTSGTPNLAGHPDFFDPAVLGLFRDELASQIEPLRDDPNILGWSYGNEYGALITRDEIREIIAQHADTPSKRALLDHALDDLYAGSLSALADAWGLHLNDRDQLYTATPTPPDSDVETLRCWYEDRWYGVVYDTVKGIDPNHLVIAPWCAPGWWESDQDWYLQARHSDLMGYDRYAMSYEDADMARLKAGIDVPTFVGEFSFPPTYDFERGYGLYQSSWAEDDADAGQRYYDWMKAAAEDPSCVGLNWFQYRDQPLTGRGPGYGPNLVYGEHYAFGAVTVTDRPKWPLVRRMRDANLQAARWRLTASSGPFADVPKDHWAASEIVACVDAGIVTGYSDGCYRPEVIVSRDQVAVFLARAVAGGDDSVPPDPQGPTFTDVPPTHWAYRHIEYAAANGIVQGYANGTYCPDDGVTRDQMAVLVTRSMAFSGGYDLTDLTPPANPSYTDVPASSWCYPYVEYLREQGVVSGYPDSTYRPTAPVTRDQMAVYLARAFDLIAR